MLTTYVLGAGFSRPAGLPLGHEIFSEVIRFAKRDKLYDNILGPDLERYRLFMRRTTGKAIAEQNLNFEEFVAFLDVEHSLRLTGRDTWTDQGNESQLVIRNLIAQVLWYRQRAMKPDIQQLYDTFAARLDDSDIVFTFNYDTILEDSLDRIGKPYRLFPSRYQELNQGVGTLDTTDNEVVILKMHGSMDWFDRTSFEKQSAYWSEQGYPGQPPDEVFSRSANVLEPLVNGLYPEHSPLKKIYRLRKLETYLWNASLVHDAPVIITPSFNKILYVNPVREFWWGFGYNGSYARNMAIIGFSLPAHDIYVQQAIYSLVRNFQHFDLGPDSPKAKLKLVDFRSTKEQREAYRSTYRFVVKKHTRFLFDGFGEYIFDELCRPATY